MNVFVAQQNYHIGNFTLIKEKILNALEEATQKGADLVVFSELSICGYPPRDLLEFDGFLAQVDEAVAEIGSHVGDVGIVLGVPTRNHDQTGKPLFNSAVLIHQGKIIGKVNKTLLPNYDVFDEYRYFEPASSWNVIEFKGKRIALTICEDIWNLGDNMLYKVCPMDHLMAQKPELMINISASPFDYDHDEDRKEVIRLNVKKYKLPMIYCNSVGAQTEIVFDGGSLIYDQHGNLFREMKYFEEDGCLVDTNDLMDPAKSTAQEQGRAMGLDMRVAKTDDPDKIVAYLTSDNNMSQIKSALVLGIRDYFGKMGFPKAILGSSGGIDSAVTLALAVEALGKENVTAILMPSDFSSDHSVSDALELSSNLGNPFEVVSIQNVYETFLQTLSPVFKDSPFGLAEENIQSRSRGNLLMAIANKFGFVLLNTSNKSELATGYGTLYGDMAGGLSVLGDLYKTQVYALARFINKEKEIIPESIITKAPSAELRPGQKDSDSLPEYDVLDRILYLYIERYQSAREIVAKRFDLHVVQRVLHLINTSEYKRNQFCPIIRVSCKAFGVGRRIPIVAKHVS